MGIMTISKGLRSRLAGLIFALAGIWAAAVPALAFADANLLQVQVASRPLNARLTIKKPPARSSRDTKQPGNYGPKGLAPQGHGMRTAATLSGSQYWYAQAIQSPAVSTTSATWQMDIKDPGQVSATGGEHSLAEAALSDSTHQQIVELGWNVDPNLYGDNDPHVFVYNWVNGNQGCYNGCGWVDSASNPVDAGSNISTDVGTLKTFSLMYDAATDAIWAYYNGSWLGYFPESVWTGASPAASLTSFQKQQFFGEVYSPASTVCDDMGDGLFPLTGAARIGSVTYAGGSSSVNLVTSATNSSYYDAALLTGSVRSFAYGGPGGC